MAYRDELDAARAHLTAVERELADAKAQSARDEVRIASLERKLEDARRAAVGPPVDGAEAPARGRRQKLIVGGAVACVVVILAALIATRQVVHRPAPPVETVDVSATLATATAEARVTMPDAQLAGIEATAVDASGVAHVAVGEGGGGHVRYRFMSPSRVASTSPVENKVCAVTIDYGPERVVDVERERARCGRPLAQPPHCLASDVWSKAASRGAPTGASRADLALTNDDDGLGRVGWTFTTLVGAGPSRAVFTTRVVDDCPPR